MRIISSPIRSSVRSHPLLCPYSTAGPVITDLGEGWTKDPKKRKASVRLQKLYARTELLWVAIALASLAAQATKTASTSDSKLKFLSQFLKLDVLLICC